jgi:Trypsin-like peptidase domain
MSDVTAGARVSMFEVAKRAVVRVGGGRGFVVSAGDDRYVLTAAHCLPHSRFPRPHLANSVSDLTFRKIIGPLASKQRTICAELCVLNLIDDVAVFTEPDCQALWDENDQYGAFTEQAMMIGQSPQVRPPYECTVETETPARLLSLDGQWLDCTVQNNGRFLTVRQGNQLIKPGMSGSPIVNADGAAIGLVSTSGDGGDSNVHPSLADCLPAWLSRKLDVASAGRRNRSCGLMHRVICHRLAFLR